MGNIDMLKLKKIKILSLLVYLERIAIYSLHGKANNNKRFKIRKERIVAWIK